MKYQILEGDNRQTLKTLADNSIDAIVTDPPYGIDFLGKAWDANTGALETYQECLRVLKPGGHILAFSAARTYHHLAVTLEQAGFEIRDQIMWIYSSGFPKSQDIGRSIQRSLGVKEYEAFVDTTKNAGFGQTDHARVRAGEAWSTPATQVGKVKVTDPEAKKWEGWGTALKPAHEPIALARKPLHKNFSIAKNAQVWGTGALNIDATRIPYVDAKDMESAKGFGDYENLNREGGPSFRDDKPKAGKRTSSFHNATGGGETQSGGDGSPQFVANEQGRFPSNVIGEILQADYQKYFYCPKVSRAERHIGMADVKSAPQTAKKGNGIQRVCETCGTPQMQAKDCLCDVKSWVMPTVNGGNNHPTVKPIELMKYLIKLITPPGGVVLDPFNGSGSTGCAAVELGYEYIGCELDPKYVAISLKRIAEWNRPDNNFNDFFE